MAGRTLGADERALWARVARSVRPINPQGTRPGARADAAPGDAGVDPAGASSAPLAMASKTAARSASPAVAPVGVTLDGGWDRRLALGRLDPDMTIDLHGHSLDSAHRALDHALARAIASSARMLLVVTGKPREGGGRGLIRAEIDQWFALSRHAAQIAAVRPAHPRHGGAGALYVILRRRRDTKASRKN